MSVCPLLIGLLSLCLEGGRASWLNLTSLGTQLSLVRRHWSPNQPDDWTGHGLGGGEDCAHFTRDGRWNDDVCQRPYHWICEIELGKTS